MFDSLEGGFLPICVLAGASGYAFSRLRAWWMGLLGVLVVPIAIAYAWFWICTFMEPPGGDPIHPWDMIATTIWSVFAVPTALIAFLIARAVRAKRAKAANVR
jgi:hypothetical protein